MKYDVIGFEEVESVRFTKDQMKLMKKILKKDTETYDGISHFIRAAVIKRIREENKRLKL